MSKTFASYAFGCRVNQAEKEELDRELLSFGFQYSIADPSIYIINSCAVTAKAEREARQFINQIKRKHPKAKIIITGCAATKWIREKITIGNADWVIDNTSKNYIIRVLTKKEENNSFHIDAKFCDRNKWRHYIGSYNKYLSSRRLLLKIQDGCQKFCTYCIVPYLRKKAKSKSIKYLVSGIKELEDKISEVILTAVNTQAYGLDTKESFVDLIKNIMERTKVPRISFGSIDPGSIDRKFLAFYKKYADSQRLIDFFHIPLQSASNKILKLMKRGYTLEEYSEKINILAKINPFAFIGTDIIAGFLDETDSDYEDTYNYLAQSPIAKFHIFRFSLRQPTAAFYLARRLQEPSPLVKAKRARWLANLGRQKYRKFLVKHIGLTFPALFLDKRKNDYQEALLDNQIPVFIKSSKNLSGDIKQVKIEALKEDKLVGRII